MTTPDLHTRALYVPAVLWRNVFPFLLPIFHTLATTDHPVFFRVYNEAEDGANLEISGPDLVNVLYWEDVIEEIIINCMNTSLKKTTPHV